MKILAFIHSNDSRIAVGDFSPVVSVFSHYELGNTISPFLLLDHLGPGVLQPTRLRKGVSEHPHRGFETVTIVFKGEIEHRDSSGGGGLIGAGDVQWMTAASGVLHEEVFSPEFSKTGGTFEMLQLWVNLPAKDKLNPARYQSLRENQIPKITLNHGAGYIRVIAGEYFQHQGPAETHTPMHVFDVFVPAGKTLTLPAQEGSTTLFYMRSGRVHILDADEHLESQDMAVMSNKGSDVEFTTIQDSHFLYLSGQPLNEPIYGKGYFVMNNYSEILQAYEDLKNGQFLNPQSSE